MSSIHRTRNIRLGVGAVALAVVLGFSGTALLSGANFNSQKSVHADINAATTLIDVSPDGARAPAPVDLKFENLAPGHSTTQSFGVRNIGTTPVTLTLGGSFSDFTFTPGPSTPSWGLDYSQLRIGAGTVSGQNALSPINTISAAKWSLGTLQPGEIKTFVVDVKLGNVYDAQGNVAIDNTWNGASGFGDLQVVATNQ